MNIAIVGTGYVGLVTGACLADMGNRIICVYNDEDKIRDLKKMIMPLYEPGLEELVVRNAREKRLSFTASLREAVKASDIIFIAVGTPSKANGEADLTGIENVTRSIASSMNSYRLVVEKSTVPVETGKWVEHTIRVYNRRKVDFDVASNPEFLREGQAIKDFLNPDRIVIGVESKRARDILLELYKPLGAPILVTDIKSAEIIKHASNSFLATKISFINVISQICEKVGADVMKVAEGMGYDKRIGRQFLNAGLGYGGACLPKDVEAFIKIAEKVGCDFKILKAVREADEDQKQNFIKKIQDALWILKDKTIGILGLSFKPGTDDMRNAPSVEIIRALQAEGALVKAFDPQAMDKAKRILRGVKFCRDPYRTAQGSDCLVIVTEWNEFKELDFLHIKKLLHQPLIIDGRNIYEPKKMKRMGFRYFGMGRR
jgi:UDPglucose 6-dehydrogenase